ncbi:Chemotaxis protein PomA [Phycisphaerae bacterium RAS2]|jgi:chemotaxis protein MotA|nr:Chemotaxis protein PomA [Phycisphaerae bacterium RAS2]
MDFATLIGFIAGVAIFLWAMISGSGGDVGGFWDTPSFVMVIGGGIATTLLSVKMNRFLGLMGICKNALFNKNRPADEMIKQFVKLADISRREGVLALQNQVAGIESKFVANALQLVIDGTDPEIVKQTMEYEIMAIDARHAEGKQVLDLLGKYAPAYGMIGTLIGLVIMLQNMDDPKKIGPGMAVALLTTMYGAVMANMVCLPLADKLNNTHSSEMLNLTIAQAGIAGLQAGENPRMLESKLMVFLSPGARAAGVKAA